MIEVFVVLHTAAPVVSLHHVPQPGELEVVIVLGAEPLLEHGLNVAGDGLEVVQPVDAQQQVADEQHQQQAPVGVEQALVEVAGPEAADQLQEAALHDEREVRVQQAGMGEREVRYEGAAWVGDHHLAGHDDEADHADKEDGVARVDPDAVVTHSPGRRRVRHSKLEPVAGLAALRGGGGRLQLLVLAIVLRRWRLGRVVRGR